MRKALFLSLIVGLLAFSGIAIAADKIGTFGAPNASGTYPMEVTDDRAITVASDATFTVAGSTITDGTIYTATIKSDGAIYLGRATLDPCPTLGAGYVFFNDSTGEPCYCDNTGADLKFEDGSTACF